MFLFAQLQSRVKFRRKVKLRYKTVYRHYDSDHRDYDYRERRRNRTEKDTKLKTMVEKTTIETTESTKLQAS